MSNLTSREREILQMVANGYLNKQIARQLGTSHQQVKNQLTVIYRKIGVRDRTQAAVKAVVMGMVDVPAVFAEVDRRRDVKR